MLNTKLHLNKDLFIPEVVKKTTRSGYGAGLLELGENNKNVVALTGDLEDSTKSNLFANKFPERFIECGIAEQNMAGIAAGLALSGKIPFINSYACFSPARNWDQIRISICLSKANVKIVGSHGGIATGADGATTQALEDIAIMRVLPEMIVLDPCDYNEAKKAVKKAAEHNGPVYIRLYRPDTPEITTEDTPFEIGKAYVYNEGEALTLIASGPILFDALEAAKDLKAKHRISIEVINSPTIKPLDEETILRSVKKTGKVITVEDHQISGGLGSAVCELLAYAYPVKIERMGMNNVFGESGEYKELKDKFKFSSHHIVNKVLEMLNG